MPIDISDYDLASPSSSTHASSPVPSISESESKFGNSYSDRQYVFQPRIDSTFKQMKSFEGNIYIYKMMLDTGPNIQSQS